MARFSDGAPCAVRRALCAVCRSQVWRRATRRFAPPLLFENVEADGARLAAHIGVPYLRVEFHLRGIVGVVVVECDIHLAQRRRVRKGVVALLRIWAALGFGSLVCVCLCVCVELTIKIPPSYGVPSGPLSWPFQCVMSSPTVTASTPDSPSPALPRNKAMPINQALDRSQGGGGDSAPVGASLVVITFTMHSLEILEFLHQSRPVRHAAR